MLDVLTSDSNMIKLYARQDEFQVIPDIPLLSSPFAASLVGDKRNVSSYNITGRVTVRLAL